MHKLITIVVLVIASFSFAPAASAAGLVFGFGPNGFVIGVDGDNYQDSRRDGYNHDYRRGSNDYQPRRSYNGWEGRRLSGNGERIGEGDYCGTRMEYRNGRYYCVR